MPKESSQLSVTDSVFRTASILLSKQNMLEYVTDNREICSDDSGEENSNEKN